MLSLNIEIDKNSGFCFGVVYAIELAEEILDKEGVLYCLGDIVHNDEEVIRLVSKGLKIIDHESLKTLKNVKVLIRAHGEAPETYKIAMENQINLIDASCPVVLKLQNRIKHSFDLNENIYIFGKKGHAEVKGLLGQTNQKAVVFEDLNEQEISKMPDEITLYSQTTKSTGKFYEVRDKLKKHGKQVNVNDTICRQVSNRDIELRGFAKKYEHIIFVSGTKSSNGRVLYNICKSVNKNTYFVSNASEIRASWFNKNDSIGICGATSTPMWLMEEIQNKLRLL
jgi:4-hydroxy-3-methylbut-2-en-1-yl diphosphate reductase